MSRLGVVVLSALLSISACSSGGESADTADKAPPDNVWKAQSDAYKKAEKVPQLLDEADQQQRRRMEEQGG